jgi:hypothetical protein
MLDKAEIFVPFAKSERQADGSVVVYGKVTDATVDLDGQIADPTWSKAALGDWFERAANIREMHQPSAVGKGLELTVDGDATYLKAKIVDPVAARKVTEGVYTGYSWGAKRPIVVPDPSKKAPGGIIKGGLIVEVSVVDQPANPSATFTLAKMNFETMNALDPDLAKREFEAKPTDAMAAAARRALAWKNDGKAGGTEVGLQRAHQLVNKETLSRDTIRRMYSFFSRHEVDKKATGFSEGEKGFPSPGRVAWDLWGGDAGKTWSEAQWERIQSEEKSVDTELAKREFTTEERESAAEEGQAMPDGSYPIKNRADLKNAIQAYGRAKDPQKVKEHIMARARALGAENLIPDNWKSVTKAAEVSEEEQVAKVEQIMALVRELIAEEAMETHGDDETQCLQLLVSALCTLAAFKDIEHEEAEEMVMGAMKMAEAATLTKAGMAIPKSTARYASKMHAALTKMMGDKMCKAYLLPTGEGSEPGGASNITNNGVVQETITSPTNTAPDTATTGMGGESSSPVSASDFGTDEGGALGPDAGSGGDTGGGGDEGSAEAAAKPDRIKGGFVTREEFDALKAAMAELAKSPAPAQAYLGPALFKNAQVAQPNPLRAAMVELAKSGASEDRKQAQEWLERNKE